MFHFLPLRWRHCRNKTDPRTETLHAHHGEMESLLPSAHFQNPISTNRKKALLRRWNTKYKPLNLSRNSFGRCFSFSPCVMKFNICCRLKKFVAKRRALVYFEQHMLALMLVFHQTKGQVDHTTCNETMLHNNLRVFISYILPPLVTTTTKIDCRNVCILPAVHRGPPKMLSKWNPPIYQFHHHKCTDRRLNVPLDQILHPTPGKIFLKNGQL